jgi:hypothetical protein
MVKRFLNLIAFSFIAINSLAADNSLTNDSWSAQKEKLFQRFAKEMQQTMQEAQKSGLTNLDLSSFTNVEEQRALRMVFESMLVDPSFGLAWDEVPAPTLVGSNALEGVNSFVAANGWNMQTNDCLFDCIRGNDKSKPIRGLPWVVIHEREFPALTHDHILYVFFKGFHHDGTGIAYNPNTNHFAATINSFKPIGQHWYAWAYDHEFWSSAPQPQIYEGANVTPASK